MANQPFKGSSIFTAKDLLSYLEKKGRLPQGEPPSVVVLLFSSAVAQRGRQRWSTEVQTFLGAELDRASKSHGEIAWLSGWGLGAPALVAKVEELAAWGVKNFVGLGMAGAINAQLSIGHIGVIEKALIGEGCSKYYGPSQDFSGAQTAFTSKVSGSLTRASLAYTLESTWTTDAPYRETREDLEVCRQKGIHFVDMEASALFSVARYHNLNASAVFVASDRVRKDGWEPCFHHRPVKKSLDAALDALTIDFLSLIDS